MKVSIKEVSPCEKVLSIDVPDDKVHEEYDRVYREISKVAKLPGFRPGKAPLEMVKSRYQNEAEEEVLKKLLSRSLREALSEHKIDPLLQPEIGEIDFKGSKLRFNAYVSTRPEVKLGKYAGLKVQRRPVKVEAGEIDKIIDEFKKRDAKHVPVEGRGLEFGDFLVGDIRITAGGNELDRRENEWLEFQSGNFFPEITEALKGVLPGGEKSVDFTFPKEYGDKTVAGKKGLFEIKVKELKTRILPETNAEWVREVGEYRSVEELRQAIEKDLADEKEREEEHRIQNEILGEIIKSSSFGLPRKLVELTIEDMVEDVLKNFNGRGLTEAEAAAKKEELKKDLREKVKPEAEQRVRLSFVLEKIAEEEKIEVSEKDLDERIEDIAKRANQPKEKVYSYYEAKNRLNGLAHDILNKKVLKFLRDKAEVTG